MDAMMQLQSDRERRIQERRKRIQERLAALREGEASGPVREIESKQADPGKQQALESVRKIMALRIDTSAVVSAIPLQADAAENHRRMAEEKARQDLRTRMLAEAEQSARKNAAVAMHWADLFTIDVPQELWEEIRAQKKACDAIIQSKNDLINSIKRDLKIKDNDFSKLLKQQMDDIGSLLQAMNDQLNGMSEACKSELEAVERAYMQDRKVHLEQSQAEMQQAFDSRGAMEAEFMERYLALVESYQKQLFDLQASDAQEYNSLKIRLESDRQSLERHMETMLATYQLNIEKLDYNYRVLVERDHENSATINQQKRRIARQRDLLANLKARYRDTDKKLHEDNMKLTAEYRRTTEQFKDLQVKFQHFELVDTKKFSEVWAMKEAEVVALARRVMAADKVLHEQQLGLDWRPPNEEVLWSPYSPQAAEAERQLEQAGGAAAGDDADEAEAAHEAALRKLRELRDDPRLADAMRLITDESGFLLEPKVREKIAELPADEAGSVRLDALLEVLGASDALALEALVAALDPSSDVELRAKGMATSGGERGKLFADGAAPPLVAPDDVIRRLRAFVEAEGAGVAAGGAGKKSKAAGPRLGVSRRTLVREREFWERVANVVDARGARVWGALQANLEKYLKVLQKREKALRSVENLGRQNVELRALLNQYLSSPINSELKVPPTQLI